MNILAFDTSMGACSAAIAHFDSVAEGMGQNASKCLSFRFEPMYKGHAERLLPMIKEVMTEASLTFEQIDRIAVTLGPGTFTGARIGVATARGLALASQKPIIASSSLHLIVLTWLARHEVLSNIKEIAVVLDARRGDVYLQRFTASGEVLDAAQMLSISEASVFLGSEKNEKRLLLGEGRLLLHDLNEKKTPSEVVKKEDVFLPEAQYLALIADKLEISKTRISPLYLRKADAKVQIGKTIERK